MFLAVTKKHINW